MTYAPSDLLDVRKAVIAKTGMTPTAVGIVGNREHFGGYHCGSDRLVANDYSNQDWRDRQGLSQAASALDLGNFGGLRRVSIALADACRHGVIGTDVVREVIYSADGRNVKRWDARNESTTGDSSHLTHTHISFFRNSEGKRAGAFKTLLLNLIDGKSTDSPSNQTGDGEVLTFIKVKGREETFLTNGITSRWVTGREITSLKAMLATGTLGPVTNGMGTTEMAYPESVGTIVGPRPANWGYGS